MSDFAPQVVRQLKDIDDRLARLESYPVGPALAELPGDFLDLPGLRGLWLPGSADNTGAMYDRSGQGRTLTYNGNPTLNLHNSTVPYWDYDGTDDYHSRADEAGLDVLGTETYVASSMRGLTMGGWFWLDTAVAFNSLISKWTAAGNQRSYQLLHSNVSGLYSAVTGDGSTEITTTPANLPISTGAWHFCATRYTPSVSLMTYLDGSSDTNTTSIPASLFNSTAAFEIGSRDVGASPINGRCALSFLCAAALPDDLLNYLWMRGRAIFGV